MGCLCHELDMDEADPIVLPEPEPFKFKHIDTSDDRRSTVVTRNVVLVTFIRHRDNHTTL